LSLLGNIQAAVAALFGRIGKTPYDERGSPYVPAWSYPPKRSSYEWLEMYGRSPMLSAVRKISEDLSFINAKLLRKNPAGEDELMPENHMFWQFWNNPNPLPQFTKEALWQLHHVYLKLTGESYMVIERDMWGYPSELWPLPPHWVMSTPGAGNPHYMIRTPSGMTGQIHVSDMFVQTDLNPLDPYGRGLGEAQSIADEAETDEYASAFEKRMFYNDATPGSIVSIEGANAESVKRFEARWNSKFRGVESSHGTAFVSEKVNVVKLADNMKDLDMINGRFFLRDMALSVLHIPKEIMGITENSNRATADAAQFIYAQTVLTPPLKKWETAINTQLVPYWGEDLRMEFEDIIPHNQEFDRQTAFDGWNVGLLTKNESRELLGFAPEPFGDIYQSQLLFQYIPANTDPTKIQPPQSGFSFSESENEKSSYFVERLQEKASEDVNDERFLLETERAAAQRERQLNGILLGYFLSQAENIENNISTRNISLTGLFERLEEAVDWEAEEETLGKLLANAWEETSKTQRGIASRLYQVITDSSQSVPETYKDIYRLVGADRARIIIKDTREKLRSVIQSAMDNGEEIDVIKGKIV
jgi:HK97 family phage portal protein